MNYRTLKDEVSKKTMFIITLLSMLVVVLMAVGLYIKSSPILREHSLWSLLTESEWTPMKNKFGFFPFLVGTMYVTGLSILIAFPISLFMAIFLVEYSKSYVKKYVYPLLDILSGLPSVIYGIWGTLIIIPVISKHLIGNATTSAGGYSVLAGGIVLSVMILPLLVSLFVEIFNSVPHDMRESSVSLGATKWQTTKSVVLRSTIPGIIASVVIAISRALGETIAVLMVCGNIPMVPQSLLDACYPIPSLIANNYGEMMSRPLYESALMFAALILFVVVLVFNVTSRIVLYRLDKSSNQG